LALAASLALLLFVGTGFTSYAATQSQPDSPLYPIKLRLEEVRLWLAFRDDNERLDLRIDQLERRLAEVRWLMANDKPVEANVLNALKGSAEEVTAKLERDNVSMRLEERAKLALAQQGDLLVVAWSRVAPPAKTQYAKALAEGYNGLLALEEKQLPQVADKPARISPEDLVGGVVRIAGAIEECCGNKWRIAGTAIAVPPGALKGEIASQPIGKQVVVTAARSSDGTLRALEIASTGAGQQPEQPRFSLEGTLQDITDNRLNVSGWQANLGQRAVRLGRLSPGHLVQVQGTVQGTAEHRVDTVRSLSPEQASRRLIYEGAIEKIDTAQGREYWTVSGQRFLISGAFIDAHPQPYVVGARVQLAAQRMGNELVVQRAIVLAGQGQPGAVKVEGVVGQMRGGWSVGGIPVAAGSNTPQPTPASHVLITGIPSTQGQLTAEDIIVFPAGLLRLQGTLQRVSQGQIVLAGIPITLTAQSYVAGTPIAGARAVVWGQIGPDGGWVAHYVDVLDARIRR
jgi:hypothetical protein